MYRHLDHRPRPKPPSGAELWYLLQDPIPEAQLPSTPEERAAESDRVAELRRINGVLQQQRDAALELIARSTNMYLRYYRWRHRFLLWWRRVRG